MNNIGEQAKVQTQTEQTNMTKKYYKVDFAKLARLIYSELDSGNTLGALFNNFPKDKVVQALQNPQKNEQVLRNLSNFLYFSSSHYKRLCNYYSQMLKFDYYVEPYKQDFEKINVKTFKQAYFNTLFELDNINVKHEFQKINDIITREGIFYGYIHKTEDSFFIQKLDPDYCRLTSHEDGVYNYKFNFQYFDKYPDYLANYSQEFQTKYNEYKNSKKSKTKGQTKEPHWMEILSQDSICIKHDETIPYPCPPFAGVFPDLYEIQDYKALKKANQEMQNYAILVGSIPYNNNKEIANDFKLELDTAIDFGNKIIESLPDQVGFLLSPYEKMDLFKLSDDKVSADKVEEAVSNFWSASGVSKDLFTTSGGTDAAVKRAIITDEQIVFTLLRQFERWINRYLKITTEKKYKFKVKFLNITHQNENDVIARLQKSASYGLPIKSQLSAAFGMSPSEMIAMTYLENEILDLPNNFIPLISANTVSIKDSPTGGEAGKPNKEQKEQSGEE